MQFQGLKSYINFAMTRFLGKSLAFALAKAIPSLAISTLFLSSFYTISVAAVSDEKLLLLLLSASMSVLAVAMGILFHRNDSASSFLLKALTDYGYLSGLIVSTFGALVFFQDYRTLSIMWLGSALLAAIVRLSFNRTILVSHQVFLKVRSTSQALANSGVSIVIPCRNGSLYLRDSVESIMGQTFSNWELIIVDDCSTDDSLQVSYDLALRDSRIKVLHLRKNVGLPAARNSGFMTAKGKYILFLDCDDAMLPDALANRISLLARSNDAWGAGAKTMQVEPTYDWRHLRIADKFERVEKITLGSVSANSPFAVHEIMLKSNVFRALGGFDENLMNGAEDADFWLRALQSGARFYRSETPDSIYRQHSGSMISMNVVQQAKQTIQVIQDSLRRTINGFSYSEILEAQAIQSRLLQFIGMTFSSGDIASRAKLVDLLSSQSRFVLPPEIAHFEIKKGFKRGLKRNDASGGGEESTVLEKEMQAIAEKFSTLGTAFVADGFSSQNVKSAVFVETAGQMSSLTTSLIDVPEDKLPTLIFAEAFTGNQGAKEILEFSGRKFQTLTLTQYQINGYKFSNFFTFEPTSWIALQLMKQSILEGTKVYSVQASWSTLVTVNDDDYSNTRLEELESDFECIHVDQVPDFINLGQTIGKIQRDPFNVNKLIGVKSSGSQGDYSGLSTPDFEELNRFKDMYLGKKCIIIGNGPSLNLIDFSLFKDTPTFGVNSIFLAKDRLPSPISFYVVEDTKVFEENESRIYEFAKECDNTFLPTLYKEKAKSHGEFVFFRMNGGFYRKDDPYYCHPRFSFSADEVTYCGQSVTMQNLQLAFWMGFTEVALIGMDFSYSIPKETEVVGHHYHSKGDDPNHFDKSYFGAGKTWKDPRLNRVAANYELAKTAYEAAGRKIYNCSVGGSLEVFDRMSLEEFLKVPD